jgi:hypothetical protein
MRYLGLVLVFVAPISLASGGKTSIPIYTGPWGISYHEILARNSKSATEMPPYNEGVCSGRVEEYPDSCGNSLSSISTKEESYIDFLLPYTYFDAQAAMKAHYLFLNEKLEGVLYKFDNADYKFKNKALRKVIGALCKGVKSMNSRAYQGCVKNNSSILMVTEPDKSQDIFVSNTNNFNDLIPKKLFDLIKND